MTRPTDHLPDAGDSEPSIKGKYRELRRLGWIRAVVRIVGFLFLMVFFYFALSAVEFSIAEMMRYSGQFSAALEEYFPLTPYLTVLGLDIPFIDFDVYWAFIQEENLLFKSQVNLASGTFDVTPGAAYITLAIGFAGTILGFPGALLLGILGSERVTPYPFNFIFRGIMSTIRAIPALVWVLIYIPLGGVSPFTATLAVGTDTIGNLGRLFTDELEEISEGPIEAIRSTGASKSETVVYGMLSQVSAPFIAWTMYIFEINTRIAVTMGLIGGGGLGLVLETQRRLFHFSNMMATILVILLLVISVEMISQRTRSHLRGGDVETQSFFDLLLTFPRKMVETLWK